MLRLEAAHQHHARPRATPTPRTGANHALLVLQRSAGNHAVTRLVSGPVVVQRAARSEHLAALNAAIDAGEWQEVATRLNGFNDADIVRLSASLSVGEAANTRAAVATYLAGWPQEQTIIAALDRGRAEVARIGKIYQAYQQAVRDSDWPGATRQLHAMSKADIDERLRRLTPDQLRDLCAAAPEASDRVAPIALQAAQARGVDVPAGLGPLVVGDRDVGATRTYTPGGETTVTLTSPLAEGSGAAVGARHLADGPVRVLGVLGPAALAALVAKPPATPGPGPGSGTFPTGPPASGTFPTGTGAPAGGVAAGAGEAAAPAAARTAVGIAVRVPIVGVAFVVGAVGPYAAGWAVVHAAEVDKALGEFGGTLPPGGAPLSGGTVPGAVPQAGTQPGAQPQPHPHQDEDDERECTDCPPGTHAVYGGLDALGRATGVRATLKGRTWSGSVAQEDPAGFVSGVSGKYAGQHRAHLLARTLGGSGGRDNLVPFGGLDNIRMYHDLERHVEEHVTFFPTHCVSFVATPSYDGNLLHATRIHLTSRDLCTGDVVVDRPAINTASARLH